MAVAVIPILLFAGVFSSTSVKLTEAIQCYNGSCVPPGCDKVYGTPLTCDSSLQKCAKVVLVNSIVGEIIRFCTQSCVDGYIRNPQGELFIYCCSSRDLCNAGSGLRIRRAAFFLINAFFISLLLLLFYGSTSMPLLSPAFYT